MILTALAAGAVGFLGGAASVVLLACLASSRINKDGRDEGR